MPSEKVVELIKDLQNRRTTDRSELNRMIAIAITESEKLLAYLTYIEPALAQDKKN